MRRAHALHLSIPKESHPTLRADTHKLASSQALKESEQYLVAESAATCALFEEEFAAIERKMLKQQRKNQQQFEKAKALMTTMVAA